MKLKKTCALAALLFAVVPCATSYADEVFFPDKAAVFKALFTSNILVQGATLADSLSHSLAEHQNADPGVSFKAVCEESYQKVGDGFVAPCSFSIQRVWRHGNVTQTTYQISVKVHQPADSDFEIISAVMQEKNL